MKLKYLVTGTGRCGTVFMARWLTLLGVPCGHETIFDWRGLEVAKNRLMGESPLQLSFISTVKWDNDKWHTIPEWLPDVTQIQADSSYMAVPFLNEDILMGTTIIHVVRHPLRVANSFCRHIEYFKNETPNNSYEQFIYKQVPELTTEMPQFDRACLFYVRWNQMIKADFVHRIEHDTDKLAQSLGLEGNCLRDKSINAINKTGNKIMSLQDIQSETIRQELVELGRSYGYHMQSEYLLI